MRLSGSITMLIARAMAEAISAQSWRDDSISRVPTSAPAASVTAMRPRSRWCVRAMEAWTTIGAVSRKGS